MASTGYTLAEVWNTTNRYQASGDTDISISNNSRWNIFFTVTASGTAPATIPAQAGQVIKPYERAAIQLPDTDYVYLAGNPGAFAGLDDGA